MIKTEFIVVGQGISGTFLSWYLRKAGRPFIVIDNNDLSSSSRVAAGIINPITGRRMVRTWMIDTLLPFADNAYKEFGKDIGINVISRKKLIDFFPSPQMLNAFKDRVSQNDDLLSLPVDQFKFEDDFVYDFGFGEIDPCFIVDLSAVLATWRTKLINLNSFIAESFDEDLLSIQPKGVSYKNISADKIIFCNGVQSSFSRWFKNLPFALNKGEALLIEADIPSEYIYKKGITLAPLQDGLFWAGSSHEWEFSDNLPSETFRVKTEIQLKQWLKVPFNTVARLASVRPATVERRPFVGMHPHIPSIGILNGMGTKGCSLSPYFASQLVDHLTKNTAILPEADIARFNRILKSTS